LGPNNFSTVITILKVQLFFLLAISGMYTVNFCANTQVNIHFAVSYLPAMQIVPNEAGRYEQTADEF
jgi:hypothetical protein